MAISLRNAHALFVVLLRHIITPVIGKILSQHKAKAAVSGNG
jgi:hypothetical protein